MSNMETTVVRCLQRVDFQVMQHVSGLKNTCARCYQVFRSHRLTFGDLQLSLANYLPVAKSCLGDGPYVSSSPLNSVDSTASNGIALSAGDENSALACLLG